MLFALEIKNMLTSLQEIGYCIKLLNYKIKCSMRSYPTSKSFHHYRIRACSTSPKDLFMIKDYKHMHGSWVAQGLDPSLNPGSIQVDIFIAECNQDMNLPNPTHLKLG
eukprot:TRINITY_DN23802_c0_g1_i1.p1 TRINITY_DN23802_c0_g1~~TRINITY_DN23802_c0_g1_i1.p1  ORF type:complete len:108 (-),score=5.82 TRINITY_DN23802_c0_g1_i1:831-1154(-)